ncbi:hypothetical protein [Chitinophaga eiseniae]|uniref:Uncharacterized protein n=1 Tax=Chitinophaga eiseniae TaxID=634771 RepID=A0A847SJZ2_9BACT|nr:hypothetical protein [Chitinophaga eiseniae]NLR77459.1 hypothetical protein [Chitinophaga eiseniae]
MKKVSLIFMDQPMMYLAVMACLLMAQVSFAQDSIKRYNAQFTKLAMDSSIPVLDIGRSGDPGNQNVPLWAPTGGAYNIDFHGWRDVTPGLIGARIRAERINIYQANAALVQGMDLTFHTTGSVAGPLERMRITSGGHVSVGVQKPAARFHVAAPYGIVLAKYTQVDNTGGDGEMVIYNAAGADTDYIPTLRGRAWSRGRGYGLYMLGESEDIVPLVDQPNIGAVTITGLSKNAQQRKLLNNNVFTVNNNTDNLFVIKANGNIGIGAPDTKGYKLAVNGAGVFTRVVVKAYTNWPDYVFATDYSLPSIAALEQYVATHQHLPEIPSAKEVVENGQDLGEMNRLLLKKVEELTLYIIQLNKRVDEQQAQIKLLQK